MSDYQYGSGYRKELSWAIPVLHNKMKILEIGCGYGNFKTNFPTDVEYWGVDSNPNVVMEAKAGLDYFFHGSFEEIKNKLPDNYFDYVICNDVIEHMVDEDDFLISIKNKIKDKGFLVGSIPNVRYITNIIRFIFLRDWSYAITGILDKTHLRFFTKKSLIKTFSRNKYIVIELRGINPYSLNPNKRYYLKEIVKYIIIYLLIIIFGYDSKYLQFGFRLKKDDKN